MKVMRSTRQGLRSWALRASIWAALACGTDHVELRRPPAAEPPDAASAEPAGDKPSSSAAPVTFEIHGGDRATLRPGAQLDMTAPPPAPIHTGCTKVDFLFAIDDSSSMSDEQANLARSFPAFVRVVRQILEVSDFHIMVVSTGGRREDEEEPALDPEACEDVQGAGKRRSAEGNDCAIMGGLPYMANGQPELEATFACAAAVGTDGDASEEPMAAILAAAGPSLNAEGRCNAGFLRPDALLVVTLISDEEDSSSSGEPEDWRRQLLEVKGGDELALVVLGLVGDNNLEVGLLGGRCESSGADGAPRLQELVSSLDGVLGSVCAPDYEPFFQTAAGKVHSACKRFGAAPGSALPPPQLAPSR